MTDEPSRVRLQDVRVAGDVADHGALIAAIERAVAASIPPGRTDVASADVRTTVADRVREVNG